MTCGGGDDGTQHVPLQQDLPGRVGVMVADDDLEIWHAPDLHLFGPQFEHVGAQLGVRVHDGWRESLLDVEGVSRSEPDQRDPGAVCNRFVTDDAIIITSDLE